MRNFAADIKMAIKYAGSFIKKNWTLPLWLTPVLEPFLLQAISFCSACRPYG